ncbi:hypothetical protein SCALM49S_04687 [Streptomyces californicus]
MLLSFFGSGLAILLCAGPGAPPYFLTGGLGPSPSGSNIVVSSTWSPNSSRMVKILSVFSRPSSTYFLSPSLTTLEPLRFATFLSPASTCSSAASRCSACCSLKGPSRLCSTCPLAGAGSRRSTVETPEPDELSCAWAVAKVDAVAALAAMATTTAAARSARL